MRETKLNKADSGTGRHQGCRSLVELLSEAAAEAPQQRAFAFLPEGEDQLCDISYLQLHLNASAIAAFLKQFRPEGQRVLLLYPAGLDFLAAFFGCLYCSAIAVPMSPPNPARLNRTLPRFRAVAQDAQPLLVLSTSSTIEKIAPLLEVAPDLKALRWVPSDEVAAAGGERWAEVRPRGEDVAYLQYTSGSTSLPKGVMVSHSNVLQHAAGVENAWLHTPDSVFVTWLPHFHDYGLIYGLLQPMYNRVPCYVMPPLAFLQRPIRWLKAISRFKGTHSGAPNFAYDLCVRKTTPEQRADLDLSSWKVAVNGSETVRRETMERFAQVFEPYGFRFDSFCPGYGLAEGILVVTTTRRDESPTFCTVSPDDLLKNKVSEVRDGQHNALPFVALGSPLDSTKLLIVNPETGVQCQPDEVGEIWVGGPLVTAGYWNQPLETDLVFGGRLSETGEGPFLRTGDLGFVRDGLLYMAGRIKDLIIIRGQNHHPQDIELTVESSHEAVRAGCAAAFSVEAGGEERLVVIAEVSDNEPDLDAVLDSIRRSVANRHGLKVDAVLLTAHGTIHKTSSGKLQRGMCRAEFLTGKWVALKEWRADLSWQTA